MADFVKYQLDDETEVLFESAEADLVSILTGDVPDTPDRRQLSGRLALVAKTVRQIAETSGPMET